MNHAPWLDETEMRIWLAFLESTGRVMQRLDAALKVDAGLRLDDYEVLVHLSESDEHRLRMTELSERLLHSQARLTQRINRLADRGLVRREKCPHDRRGTYAVITDLGIEVIERAAPGHVREVRDTLIDLIEPDEREVVARVLERVATAAGTGGGLAARPSPVGAESVAERGEQDEGAEDVDHDEQRDERVVARRDRPGQAGHTDRDGVS